MMSVDECDPRTYGDRVAVFVAAVDEARDAIVWPDDEYVDAQQLAERGDAKAQAYIDACEALEDFSARHYKCCWGNR